jgi:hypothetical protein
MAKPPRRKAPAKDPAAVSLGRKGGTARMAKLTKAERTALARKALAARWGTRAKKRAT